MTKSDIHEIRIDVELDGENALSMMLCRDGTVARRGSGGIPAVPTVVLGRGDGHWFADLVDGLDERVLTCGGVFDLPDKRGTPVSYTVVFLGGDTTDRRVLCGFRFLTGSEANASTSLLPYFDAFAQKTVRLTERWYCENLE